MIVKWQVMGSEAERTQQTTSGGLALPQVLCPLQAHRTHGPAR